jgi:hypothetical protein
MNILLRVVLLSIPIFLLCYQNAYAYLDPGTGSYILQVVMAVFLGAIFTIKVYWQKILGLFRKNNSLKQSQNDTDERK